MGGPCMGAGEGRYENDGRVGRMRYSCFLPRDASTNQRRKLWTKKMNQPVFEMALSTCVGVNNRCTTDGHLARVLLRW